MEFNEPLIRTGHPPHPGAYKKKGLSLSLSLFHILRKVTLFVVIFVLSFHLPNFIPGLNQREQTIREILEVLERHPTGLANVTKAELAEVIYEEAIRYNHDPKFILALIAIESSFQNWSVSEQGAKGLMQIMPYVAESLAQEMGIEWSGDRTLFNPYLNIKMGIYYLTQLTKDFNDIRLALAAYNYGPTYIKGLMERKEGIPLNYNRKFLTAYQNI
jgi:soluble lytic murein transglycosylase-like protein